MSDNSKKFLYDYLNNHSPTGYEISGQKIWLDYIKPYVDRSYVDTYGTAVAIINPEAKYKVVIEAHADEISWYINYITKEGLMHVIRNGGSDYQIAPSMHAKIHGDKGVLPAVFGWPAIHVRDKQEQVKHNVETIVLDAGFSSDKEVVQAGIHVGSVVTFDQNFKEINGYYVGRAVDNRIGGYTIAEAVRILDEQKVNLGFGLYIVNSVQEEVGLRGAQMIARRIQPDVALVIDVTHDTQTRGYSKIKQGDIHCKKGPVIRYAPSVQRNLRRMLEQVAKDSAIPFQRAAASRLTNDTSAFAYSGDGRTAAALIGLPLKYMHTTVEMVHHSDVDHAIQLYVSFLKQLKAGHSFNYM